MFSSYLKRFNEYKYGKLIIVENKKCMINQIILLQDISVLLKSLIS